MPPRARQHAGSLTPEYASAANIPAPRCQAVCCLNTPIPGDRMEVEVARRTNRGNPRRALARQRAEQVLTLRATGMTFAQIAERVGVADRSVAYRIYVRALRTPSPLAERVRMEEDRR